MNETVAPAPGAPRWRKALLGVLVVALLVSGGTLVWLVAQRVGQDDDQAQRETVMSQTRQFMLRMGTYGPDMLDDDKSMPDYRKRVTEVITPKFATSFDESVTIAEKLVAQSGQERGSDVYATGVGAIDDDSATVLVSGAFTLGYGKSEELPERLPFRLEVSLVKIDGDWLVDDYTPVTEAQG